MSHSTLVEVSVTDMTFAFTYGTRKPAEMLEIGVSESKTFEGHEALIILADVVRTHNPGDFEFKILNQMIDKARDIAAEYTETNLHHTKGSDEGIRTSIRDIIKMTQVIARVFHLEEANFNPAQPLHTEAEVQKILEAAQASSVYGSSTRSVLCSLLSSFLNKDSEILEQSNVVLSSVVWEWMQYEHCDFLDYVRNLSRSEMNYVFRVTFHHHD